MLTLSLRGVVLVALLAGLAHAVTPDDPGVGDVRFTINASSGVRAISPYIYGMNSFFNALPTGASSGPVVTLDRLGGNRWTGYNWETGASSAGSDFQHVNDNYLVNYVNNTPPGEAVRPALVAAGQHGRAVLVTVPTAGYVSADSAGTVTAAQVAPSSRWNQVVAKKSSIYPGSALSLAPNESDDYAFTDEFVNWVEQSKPAGVPTFYSLDNEPGLWDSTHPRLHPGDPTYAELRSKVIAHAGAIKDVAPGAKVFGPAAFGWSEFQNLQGAPDAVTSPSHPGGNRPGELNYLEWLLNEVRIAEQAQGRTLLDVLDVHWYPEATGGGTRITFDGVNNTSAAVVAARVQAPRSLWDPTYTETSWITQFSSGGPIALLSRLQRDIDDFKPGTEIAITEYNYGGGAHISGGVAQADVLGIFGERGVYAASWWNAEGTTASAAPFVQGAFSMFRNFDGQGGAFGDISVSADSDSIAEASVYASTHSDDPNRMTVVAINRTAAPLDTAIQLSADRRFRTAEVFQLSGASATPASIGTLDLTLVNALRYTLPAYSVTTFDLLATGIPGDFSGDGVVDAADYTVWRDGLGTVYAQADYTEWAIAYGSSEAGGVSVPEPAAAILGAIGWMAIVAVRGAARR